jgi:menaquinone-dependent protoporphyrinogen oxidase
MSRILVTFATMAGSTAETAQAVAEEIFRSGAEVDVLPLHEVRTLEGYDGVVLGAPMIMGWHRDAQRFLKKHRAALERIPLAVFVLAMSLTGDKNSTTGANFGGAEVCVDEKLPTPPKKPGSLSFKERYTSLGNYLRPIFKAAHPVSVGVFGGRLEFGRLKWWAILFASLIIQAAPGDRRNWPVLRAWAAGLPEKLSITNGAALHS